MGVADNRSYKNEYHFTDDTRPTREQQPSIQAQPRINTTIKENPYRANTEIEGGEIVLQPDLSAIYKASGKRHSKGGMDVLLKPDSFVFSDFDGLKITEDEHELFELKEGGTPAETVKKNINIKHYNTLSNNLSNPYKDDLAKKSSVRMLEKYLETLGNIAFIQEGKKGFPQGLPPFSVGTAPVYNDDTKNEIMENKQYARAGGKITGLHKLQPGGVNPFTRYAQPLRAEEPMVVQKGYPKRPKGEDPRDWWYDPSIGRWLPAVTIGPAKLSGIKQESGIPETPVPQTNTPQDCPCGWNFGTGQCYPCPTPTGPQAEADKLKVPEITPDYQGVKEAKWQFTPWQRLSQMYNWGQFANARRYMPYRSRYTGQYVEPSLVNPEQVVGDMRAISNQQLSSLNTLNPILRNAQAQGTFGQLLNQVGAVRSQYDNQNAQITNLTRQMNTQTANNERLINMQNDQMYYQQAVEGRKNFDNLRTYLSNQAMNNVMRDVEANQKLAYTLLSQNNPAYDYNWKRGNFTRTNKSIFDVQSDAKADMYTELANFIMDKVRKGQNPTQEEIGFIKSLAVGKLNFSNQAPQYFGTQKKGGKVKKNPYKW